MPNDAAGDSNAQNFMLMAANHQLQVTRVRMLENIIS